MRDFRSLNVGFHQSQANIEKMGAYYTEVEHCKAMSRFFYFKEGDDYTILEPSVGNAEAVYAAIGKEAGDRKSLFAVELNNSTVRELNASDKEFEVLLEADFLDGSRIKGSSFSFCFGNPPYLDDTTERNGERLERKFLEKVYGLLKKDGVLCWVINFNQFRNDIRYLYSRFDLKHIYKFHESEYKKWHQVVIIGTKKTNISYKKEDYESFEAKYRHVEDLEELPFDYDGERIFVPTAKADDVNPFTSREFPAAEIFEALQKQGSVLDKMTEKSLTVKPYMIVECGNPPMPPKKDHLFTLAVSGIGQGLVGDGDEIHLQRGVCRVVDESTVEGDGKGGFIEVVRQVTKTSLVIFEQDGTFTELA